MKSALMESFEMNANPLMLNIKNIHIEFEKCLVPGVEFIKFVEDPNSEKEEKKDQ
jgi:hypothetical protein